jgi:hypothetical protein
MSRTVVATLAAGALLLACSADAGPTPPFRQSCERRIAWSQSSQTSCLTCLVKAQLDACACAPGEPAAAACVEESRRRAQACGADGSDCTLGCTDCTCLERCQTSQACADASAALEACLVRTCSARCP